MVGESKGVKTDVRVNRNQPHGSATERTDWVVYLIRAPGGELYTGITTDVHRRLEEHQAGEGSRYLRGRGPLAVVYRRRLGRKGLALAVEWRVKRLTKSGKEAIVRTAPSRKRLLAELRVPEES